MKQNYFVGERDKLWNSFVAVSGAGLRFYDSVAIGFQQSGAKFPHASDLNKGMNGQ